MSESFEPAAADVVETEGREPEDLTTPDLASDPSSRTLRWWPAALLLLIMVILRSPTFLLDSPSLSIMMLGFMGPPLAGLLILVAWWLFASRASLKEKLLGLGGFIVISVVTLGVIDPSLRGMGILFMVMPTGFAAFGLALVCTAGMPRLRVPIALLATAVGLGGWTAIQSEGFDGKFNPQFLWRWQPNAEERYLASLSEREPAPLDPASIEPVDLSAAPWPAFRGADRSAVITGVTLSEDWETSPPQEVWRTRVGPAWSSFSVADNRIFTQEQRGELEAVVCMDAETGSIVWDHTYPSRFWEGVGGAGPRATPTLTKDGIFALGAAGILVRLDASYGNEIWRRDLKADAGREPPTWGFAASPLVTDSLVVVHAGGEGDKGILAYDVETGEPVWSTASGNHSYSSPQSATFDSVPGLLMSTNDGLQFLASADGAVIWQHDWKVEGYRVVQPLVFGNSVVIGGSMATGARRVSVRHADEQWDVTVDWTTRDLKPDFNDCVLYKDHIYGFDSGIFCCVDVTTGQRTWKRGRYGNGQVLLLADQGQLLVSSEKGEIVLLRASPDKLTELAKLSVLKGKTWNHPVLVGNRLYIRNAQEAACFEMPLD